MSIFTCPKCECPKCKVICTRAYGDCVRRYRKCKKCGYNFVTFEEVEEYKMGPGGKYEQERSS